MAFTTAGTTPMKEDAIGRLVTGDNFSVKPEIDALPKVTSVITAMTAEMVRMNRTAPSLIAHQVRRGAQTENVSRMKGNATA